MSSTRSLVAVIAGFCALGLAIMAIIYWAVFNSFSISNIDWPLRILAIGAIVFFSIYLLATPESVGQAVGKRSTRLSANALVASIVAIAIGVAANVIIGNVSTARADLTAGQDFTLSQQTLKVLQGLDAGNQNVNAIAFFAAGTGRQPVSDLLGEYQSHTSHLKYQFVDPVAQPSLAVQYGISRSDVVVFDNGKRHEIATAATERDFTSALVRLSQSTQNTVVFLTGHGERDPNSQDAAGYSQIRQSLEQNNYKTYVKSLITSTISVSDTTVLVIAEPVRPFTTKESQTVQSYLDSGGHVLLLLDPMMPAVALQPLSDTLKNYGVVPQQGGVVDLQKNFSAQDPTVIGANSYPTSDITSDLARDQLATLFPLAMGLSQSTPPSSKYTVSPVVNSSGAPPVSWLETEIKPGAAGNIQLKYDEGKDIAGPVNIAMQVAPQALGASTPVTATNAPNTRLVVFGDVDFVSNSTLSAIQQQGIAIYNLDLFDNSVSWLAGAKELVSIQPKDPATPRGLTLDTGQKNVVFTATVLGLPIIVLLLGGLSWWRRR